MPRKKLLTNFVKGQILAHHSNCWSNAAIARELGRSRNAVRSFLKNVRGYGTKKSPGRPKKLTEAMKRRIIREASEGKLGASGIIKALDLPVRPRRVRQILQQAAHLRYKRIARTPAMREHHEKIRLSWATEKMAWANAKWSRIVWSDEKKFNLDGPDGLAYKWHDLRKEKQWFSKRQNGGSSVMIWACFAGTQKSELVFLTGKQNGKKYVKTLQDYLLTFAEDLPLTWIFMQDGASCHRSNLAKNWLSEHHIPVLDWPAYSPDLNPIENLWGILVRRVYENQRQFEDVDSLTDCIREAWNDIGTDILDKLVRSMQKRCIEVVHSKGKKIDY